MIAARNMYQRHRNTRTPSPTEHAAMLVAIRLKTSIDVISAVEGRIWLGAEAPAHPNWPFVLIADAKQSGPSVRVAVEVWGQFQSQARDVADLIAPNLPGFTLKATNIVRPIGASVGAAVVSVLLERPVQ